MEVGTGAEVQILRIPFEWRSNYQRELLSLSVPFVLNSNGAPCQTSYCIHGEHMAICLDHADSAWLVKRANSKGELSQGELQHFDPILIGSLVPRTGVEPAHSCEHQPLKLARLPISPPGPQCEPYL